MAADIKPGTTMQAGDVMLYAANARGTCKGCAFEYDKIGDKTCTNVNCEAVVWLTQHNYFVRLLTS